MRNPTSLIREARRAEQSGDLRRSIELYRKALSLQEKEGGVGELGLYNCLGDLYLRVGDAASAVGCFERAVERHEEQQLYGNAIALCKKILRNAPARTETYRRAGRLQARAGLQAEARDSYIEYANRMEREGASELALEALEEFAELSGDEEIRLALADRCLVADRVGEALGQLRRVWGNGNLPGEEREGAEGTGQEREVADRPNEEREGADGTDLALLAQELERVLNRLEGEEKLREALAAIDQLLRLEPEKVNLLQRKLTYALALGEEEAAIEAYLELGGALEKRLSRFALRFLTTSSSSGTATTVVKVVERRATVDKD